MTATMPKSPMSGWLATARLFLLVLIVLGIGGLIATGHVPGPAKVSELLATLSGKPWVWPAGLAIFVVFSSLGVPQFALIAAAVLTFGSVEGALLAWSGTMVSAFIQFLFARSMGAGSMQRLGGGWFTRVSAFVGRHGFWSAALVRLIPSGPFVLVNMAMGVSQMRAVSFLAGTGMGIVPKILAIALFGEGLRGALTRQDGLYVLAMAGIGLLAMGLIVWMGRRMGDMDH